MSYRVAAHLQRWLWHLTSALSPCCDMWINHFEQAHRVFAVSFEFPWQMLKIEKYFVTIEFSTSESLKQTAICFSHGVFLQRVICSFILPTYAFLWTENKATLLNLPRSSGHFWSQSWSIPRSVICFTASWATNHSLWITVVVNLFAQVWLLLSVSQS